MGLREDLRLRFLLAGVFNTSFALLLFAWMVDFLGPGVPAVASVFLTWCVAVLVAYVVHRKFVFRVVGHTLLDLVRFVASNLGLLALNLGTVAMLVDRLGLPPILVQSGLVCAVFVVSYLTHKHFSFRRSRPDLD